MLLDEHGRVIGLNAFLRNDLAYPTLILTLPLPLPLPLMCCSRLVPPAIKLVYISETPNTGDSFSTATPLAATMSFASDGGDCLGLGTSTDTADCQGTWEVPSDLQEGRYTIMWFWEFNGGAYYNTCADVMITAAVGGGGGGGDGSGTGGGDGGGGGGGATQPAPGGRDELSVVHVSLTASGAVSDFDTARRSQIAQAFAGKSSLDAGSIEVHIEAGCMHGMMRGHSDWCARGTHGTTLHVALPTASRAASHLPHNLRFSSRRATASPRTVTASSPSTSTCAPRAPLRQTRR